ncbi:hypothetical protein [Streptomyces sp. NPDC090054]|uniref:hypothetical protein n=1 Tax=Streptomyces sp. NPDC090054 TaxID=3365933 RepID=UPI00380736A3
MRRARFRTILTASVLAAASVAASLVVAPTAQAAGKSWGPIHARVSAGNVASASGDFANNGGVYATVGANWRDLRAGDGDPVYVEAEFFFLKNGKWESAGSSQTLRTDTSASGSLSRRLRQDAHGARAVIKVCADRTRWADLCSSESVVSFSY